MPTRTYPMLSGTTWSIQGICTGLAEMMQGLQETLTFEPSARGHLRFPKGSKMTQEGTCISSQVNKIKYKLKNYTKFDKITYLKTLKIHCKDSKDITLL